MTSGSSGNRKTRRPFGQRAFLITVESSLGASCLSLFHEGRESRCIIDRQLGEHLAIQLDRSGNRVQLFDLLVDIVT